MDIRNDLSVRRLRHGVVQRLACSLLAAAAGACVLVWFFGHNNRLFDFYLAYIVGVGAGLLIFGLIQTIRFILLLCSPSRLVASAADRSARRAADLNDRAMALAAKVFMSVMLVGLIYIGEVYNRTAFVVCFFVLVFAYFCYFLSWLYLKNQR